MRFCRIPEPWVYKNLLMCDGYSQFATQHYLEALDATLAMSVTELLSHASPDLFVKVVHTVYFAVFIVSHRITLQLSFFYRLDIWVSRGGRTAPMVPIFN